MPSSFGAQAQGWLIIFNYRHPLEANSRSASKYFTGRLITMFTRVHHFTSSESDESSLLHSRLDLSSGLFPSVIHGDNLPKLIWVGDTVRILGVVLLGRILVLSKPILPVGWTSTLLGIQQPTMVLPDNTLSRPLGNVVKKVRATSLHWFWYSVTAQAMMDVNSDSCSLTPSYPCFLSRTNTCGWQGTTVPCEDDIIKRGSKFIWRNHVRCS